MLIQLQCWNGSYYLCHNLVCLPLRNQLAIAMTMHFQKYKGRLQMGNASISSEFRVTKQVFSYISYFRYVYSFLCIVMLVLKPKCNFLCIYSTNMQKNAATQIQVLHEVVKCTFWKCAEFDCPVTTINAEVVINLNSITRARP